MANYLVHFRHQTCLLPIVNRKAERPFEKLAASRRAWGGAVASAVREGSSPSRRHAMWTAESRALVGDFGAGQALSDEQYALPAPMIPPAKPGGRPRTTDMRRMLDGLFHLVRTRCRHWPPLPPSPAFPPWRTVSAATCASSRTRTCGERSATIW